MAQLEEKYEGLHLTALSDQGQYIDLVISSVLENLLFGALLAVIVLMLFLRDFRPTIIVALSIPISLLFGGGAYALHRCHPQYHLPFRPCPWRRHAGG